MRTVYNTHVRRLRDIDLGRDAARLSELLANCRGQSVVLRVKQLGGKIDVTRSGPDLAGTLLAAGVAVAEPFDAEILVRNPVDPFETLPDRNDWNALQWNGERGTGAVPAGNPLRPAPMFFRENGMATDLVDLLRGGNGTVFLVMNGTSFTEAQQELLRNRPGVVTFGVNNGAHGFRPDLWTCVDDPSRFVRSIWEDGRILKFVPMAHFEKRVLRQALGPGRSEKADGEKVGEFPNVVGYRRNEAFRPRQWLHEDTINWGNHKKRGGGRSVMLVALRIAWLLGFRRVYLVGCDFEMTAEKRYWFPEQRTAGAIRNNERSYRILRDFFAALAPVFADAGFEIFNGNPESRLEAFPFADLAEAVHRAAVDVSASTEGMYVKREKAGTG